MDLGLRGKRALVLGASRGLGAAVARLLACEGAAVIAGSRSGAIAWAESLDSDSAGRIQAMQLDVSDRAGLSLAIATALEAGSVDILVNNSGGPPPGPAQAVEAAQWERQFTAMAANIFEATRLVLPQMRARGWGRIITIASSGVQQPIPNLALSNAVRAAIVGWSKTLAGEVASHGITVNVLVPGRIHTDRVDELDAALAARSGADVKAVAAASAATIPAGRYGTPSEFAAAAVFLASTPASYITGSQIRVDGGAIRSI
jgi:3-oxoacyl-[acyl-carrier protein] reductase